MRPILIVEDEPNIRNLIALALHRAGYETRQADDGEKAAALLEREQFDMVLLDVMLPEIDGFALMEYIAPERIPVIFITARSTLQDRVKGLRLGADDYIVKPFEPLELVARVESVLRRSGRGKTVLRAYDVEIEPESMQVRQNGQVVHLTPKEYELLLHLMRSQGTALYRSVLYERVWGSEQDSDTRTLDLHIRRLRQKLGWGDRIETVYSVGYRLKKEKL